MNNLAELYIGYQGNMDFPKLLERAQEYLSENYKELMAKGGSDNPSQMKAYIRQYLTKKRLSVDGMSLEETVDRLYTEMAEFSFLTPYLNGTIKNVEGIEINSWESVNVKFAGGRSEPAKGHFFSPKHAKDVLTRLLRQSKITMDNSKPLVRGHLGKNIRITVNGGGGTLDEDVGVAASIRFVNPTHLTKEDILRFGTLTPEMMDFLINAYRYGLSMMVAGEVNSGKTTLMSIIMQEAVPYTEKLYTIENGTREFDLVRRNDRGQIINNVVHTVTKESDDPKLAVTQQMLLEHGMTMNPGYICMAEVKGSEAFETIEAALTGHPVIGTTHTYSAEEIPDRLVQLASMQSSNLSDKTLYSMVTRAFPILFYAQRMADGVRRVTEICECQLENDRPKVIPLWRYDTQYNEVKNGKTIVHGQFVKCGIISANLQRRLRQQGIPEEALQSIIGRTSS
ncbi:MAG: Type II/IV secretion system protein [Oscillospiraceae bacterium]|jgi:pilus assembly protein CpaF